MNLTDDDVRRWLEKKAIELDKLPRQKGSYIIFLLGKGLYVWKDENYIYLSRGYFWSKKYRYLIR